MIPIKSALYSQPQQISFSSFSAGSKIEETAQDQVQAIPLDIFGKIDFIKMDIEGAEIEAIKGAKQLIKNYKPAFSIAAYHVVDGERTYKKLEKMFKKLNYKIEIHKKGEIVVDAWISGKNSMRNSK